MPPRDLHRDAVKESLVKDGWTVTDDPCTMKFGALRLFADLEQAVGQYSIYRTALNRMNPARDLFLAVVRDV
jgi:hypothetical protein